MCNHKPETTTTTTDKAVGNTMTGNFNFNYCPYCNPPHCPHCGRPYQNFPPMYEPYVVWC